MAAPTLPTISSLRGRGRNELLALAIEQFRRVEDALPWTPAEVAGLSVFHHYTEGNLRVAPAGAVSGVGDPVGYVEPLFRTTVSASEASNKPVLRADGLELDAGGVNLLTLSSPLLGTGDFTVYWAFYGSTTSVVPLLSDTVAGSLLGSAGAGEIGIYDTISNPYSVTNDYQSVHPVLGRFSYNATTDDTSLIASSQAEVTSNIDVTFPFNQIGGTGAVGVGNDNVNNRLLALVYVDRVITLDSIEDLNIRAWLAANVGVLAGQTISKGVVVVDSSSFAVSEWPALTKIRNNSLRLQNCSRVTGMSLPSLTEVLGPGDFNTGSLTVLAACINATSFSAPLLVTHEGYIGIQGVPNLTTIDLSSLASAHYLWFEQVGVTTIDLSAYNDDIHSLEVLSSANLTTVDLGAMGVVELYVEIANNPLLTSLTANSLNASNAANTFWAIFNNQTLATLSLPGLTTIACNVLIHTHDSLTTLNLANLAAISDTTGGLSIYDSPLLANVTVSASIATTRSMAGFEILGAALTEASVNAILIALDAGKTAAGLGTTIDLSGGTSAAPTGAGATAKTSLQGAGYTVLTN